MLWGKLMRQSQCDRAAALTRNNMVYLYRSLRSRMLAFPPRTRSSLIITGW